MLPDLLQAVLAAPDDDEPRLIVADALEARGDPRGEFIAVQCALARGGDSDGRLAARERQLLDAHGDAWARELRLSPVQCRFRRGFVDGVFHLPAEDFLSSAETLFRQAPLRAVGIDLLGDARGKHLARLIISPLLTRVRELFLRRSGLGDITARAVARSPYVAGLQTLVMTDDAIGNGGARAIADSRKLALLETLDLRSNRIGDPGALALVESRHLPRLRTVALQRNRLTTTGNQALARRFGTPSGVL